MENSTPSKSAAGNGSSTDALLQELRRLSERVSELERARAASDRRNTLLLERVISSLCDHLQPAAVEADAASSSRPSELPVQGAPESNDALEHVDSDRAPVHPTPIPPGGLHYEEEPFSAPQTDSASFARLAAALAEADRRTQERQGGSPEAEHLKTPARGTAPYEAMASQTTPISATPKKDSGRWVPAKSNLPVVPPDIGIPPLDEIDWNAWVTAWVLAEQRAEILGIPGVPPFSSMLFSPGGAVLDAWRSLQAGADVLREAEASEIADEQIRALIAATREKYAAEQETLRKRSSWHGCVLRLRESLHALAAIATSETQAEVIKSEACLDDWSAHMDAEAAWVCDISPYVERTALCISALHDRLADRPGSRQAQFSIETKADMVTYNAMRACELFLAQMHVQRDKDLTIGKQHDQLQSMKLRDYQTPFKMAALAGPGRAPGLQKISRIMRNRWVLTAADGKERGELTKPTYELE